LFGDRKREARKRYREFVLKGIAEGRRPALTGGGLLRSFGGWTVLKGFPKAGIRVKGDERILGDSDFERIPQKVKNIVVLIVPRRGGIQTYILPRLARACEGMCPHVTHTGFYYLF
jgi:hypothetical protein